MMDKKLAIQTEIARLLHEYITKQQDFDKEVRAIYVERIKALQNILNEVSK